MRVYVVLVQLSILPQLQARAHFEGTSSVQELRSRCTYTCKAYNWRAATTVKQCPPFHTPVNHTSLVGVEEQTA